MFNIPYLHTILFSIYPVVTLYSQNLYQVLIKDAFFPAIVMLISAFLLIFVLRLLSGNTRLITLAVSLFYLLMFSYGTVSKYMARTGGINELTGQWLSVFIIILLYFISLKLLKVNKIHLLGFTSFVNKISLLIIIIPIVPIVFNFYSGMQFRKKALSDISKTQKVDIGNIGNLPDIYYLIFDRYASQSTLSGYFGFDNSSFSDYLKNKGFYLAQNSWANYYSSAHSLTSSLNMDYLDNIINSAPAGPDDRDWTLLYNRLEENAVAKSLKSIGYKYYHFGSWWWPTGKNRLADENINLGYLSEFSARLVDSSILFPLAKKYNFPLLDSRYNQWRRINYQFDRLERIQSENSPVFVFAHFIIPHEPFVFESDGKFLTAQKESQKDINEKYLDQLVFLNGKIKSFVDIVVNSRGGNSVIILQSDEGPYPVQYESNKDSFDWTTVDYPLVSQKMAILNAIYFPDGNYEILKNGLSPVNTFRIIFNRFLGQNLPLLPDRYYLGNMSQPYNLIEYKKPPQ
ncbi:hypothetical protein A3I80_03245 [Candidatus Gottesmanbacteria bacterium RIFCSPLOWO2_02_FULL_40_10]|nr:MAG: hypothetical protein A3I80_03245 [Candidatus Gottesmanbacteria bacterium RIFCSPLOWO2_02_FULL_40_10]